MQLSAIFYQIFIFTYGFETDLFLSTSCSQLISGEPLVSCIHSTHFLIMAFALIPLTKTWNCNFFLCSIFFNLLFSKVSTTLKKNQNKYLTLHLDSCNFLTLQLDSCNFFQYHLARASSSKNTIIAYSCREVVVQI